MRKVVSTLISFLLFVFLLHAQSSRTTQDFDNGWKFYLGNDDNAKDISFDDASWRSLNLPNDWSIELPFDSTSPTGNGGGALFKVRPLVPGVTS